MMPVIRVSNETMERLGQFARPFVDKPEDVVRMALDALEAARGKPLSSANATAKKVRPAQGAKRSLEKLPQKDFHAPLIETMRELGGRASVKDVREYIEPRLKPLLKAGDYEYVSTGDPRWWNAVCWARNDLIKSGVFKRGTERGVWELADV